jgi:hypothetical protein
LLARSPCPGKSERTGATPLPTAVPRSTSSHPSPSVMTAVSTLLVMIIIDFFILFPVVLAAEQAAEEASSRARLLLLVILRLMVLLLRRLLMLRGSGLLVVFSAKEFRGKMDCGDSGTGSNDDFAEASVC